jgi:hypothetical protein
MSELQIAMIGFGVAIVLVVLAYNSWQARRLRKRTEALLPAAPDVLMAGREDGRSEPTVTPDAVLPEPTFSAGADAGEEPDAEALKPSVPLPAEWADGRADCLLCIEFVDAVPAAALWAEHAVWSATIDKPLQWLGLDAQSGRWRALLPQDQGSIIQLAAALQLVDRRGPLSEATLVRFLDGVHRLAQRFSGLVELPELAPLLARAGELDGFCAAVDLQLSLLVLPRQGSLGELPGARLKPLLEAAGLRLEGDRFVAVDAEGAEAFALTCSSATTFSAAQLDALGLTGISFHLDVPRVAAGLASFDRMMALARQCAETLGGQVVDAHQKPLAHATVEAIRTRIGELQAQLAQAGMPAGGVRALRLFA